MVEPVENPGLRTALDPGEPLEAFAMGASAVVPLADVPGALGVTAGEAAELVAGWADSGAVEVWPGFHLGPAVILSALTAGRLGLALVDAGDVLRWVPAGEVPRSDRPRGRRDTTVLGESEIWPRGEGPGLDGMADGKAPDPAREAERAEAAESDRGRAASSFLASRGLFVGPSVIVGLGTPWPGHDDWAGPCPICGGRELRPNEACIWPACDRTGLDARLAKVLHSERPRPFVEPGDDGLAGGHGASRARAKRRRTPNVPRETSSKTKPTTPRKPPPGSKAKTAKVVKAPGDRPAPAPRRNSFDLATLRSRAAV